jgi:hypothetical protein
MRLFPFTLLGRYYCRRKKEAEAFYISLKFCSKLQSVYSIRCGVVCMCGSESFAFDILPQISSHCGVASNVQYDLYKGSALKLKLYTRQKCIDTKVKRVFLFNLFQRNPHHCGYAPCTASLEMPAVLTK